MHFPIILALSAATPYQFAWWVLKSPPKKQLRSGVWCRRAVLVSVLFGAYTLIISVQCPPMLTLTELVWSPEVIIIFGCRL